MPVDLYPPRLKPRFQESRFQESPIQESPIRDGILLALWGVTMIIVSLLSGYPPPIG
jgi:hypothetical protein